MPIFEALKRLLNGPPDANTSQSDTTGEQTNFRRAKRFPINRCDYIVWLHSSRPLHPLLDSSAERKLKNPRTSQKHNATLIVLDHLSFVFQHIPATTSAFQII